MMKTVCTVTMLAVGLAALTACKKDSITLEDKEERAVRLKLESFEKGELSLDEVTSTEPGGASPAWVHRMVEYYESHSNDITLKMTLPISRCYAAMEQYPIALSLAQGYVTVFSNDWHAWRILGTVNYFMTNFQAAVTAYSNAVWFGDEVSYAQLAMTAMEADQDNIVGNILPKLFLLKDSKTTESVDRLELVGVLVIYAIRNHQEDVFLKAVEGLEPKDILAHEDLWGPVKQACERFKTKTTEDFYRKLVEAERLSRAPKPIKESTP